MFKWKLTDESELTLTVNLLAKTIEITQTRGGASAMVSMLQIPLADMKAIVKQFKDLKDYFA